MRLTGTDALGTPWHFQDASSAFCVEMPLAESAKRSGVQAAESRHGPDEGSCPKQGGERFEPVVYVTREGAVGLLQLWSPSELEVRPQTCPPTQPLLSAGFCHS